MQDKMLDIVIRDDEQMKGEFCVEDVNPRSTTAISCQRTSADERYAVRDTLALFDFGTLRANLREVALISRLLLFTGPF